MPVLRVSWELLEQPVYAVQLSGIWTWDEFLSIFDEIVAEIKQRTDTVYIVWDVSRTHHLAPNVLINGAKIYEQIPHNVALVILIGANRLIRITGQVFLRLNPAFASRALVLTTQRDAQQAIHDHIIRTRSPDLG